MITYKMHFFRTGATGEGPRKRYVGQSDLPLSDEGAAELALLREELRYPQVEMVFTSPLQRCTGTAEILYPDTFTEEAPGLMDMNLGDFEGKTFEELQNDPDFSRWIKDSLRNTPPGGEGTEEFTRRIILAVNAIFTRMMEERITNVAVITHGGVIMTLLAAIALPKMPLHQWTVGNGTGYTLQFTPQMWMRDGCAEVLSHQPEPPAGGEEDGEDPEFWGD